MKTMIYVLAGFMFLGAALLAQVFVPMPLTQVFAMPLSFAAAFCMFEAVRSALG